MSDVELQSPEEVVRNKPLRILVKPNFRPLTYLATPYSYKHSDPAVSKAVQRIRFETCSRAAAWLINEQGWNVFSPITHSHPLHILFPGIRGDWPFWEKIDTEYLQVSQRIVTLTIPGWRKSTGVTAERKIAAKLGLDSWYLRPEGETFFLSRSPLEHQMFETIGDLDL